MGSYRIIVYYVHKYIVAITVRREYKCAAGYYVGRYLNKEQGAGNLFCINYQI